MVTNIDQAASVIVKSDHTGRTRYTSEYKHEVLAAIETSSLSAPDWMGSEYTDSHDKAPLGSGVAFQHVLQIFESWFGLRFHDFGSCEM
jgi:hypothetical protein